MFAALIIDADAEAAQQIQTALLAYGFEFTITQDPSEAMNLARTATPDIIFLRVELPNVSGFSVCNKLRRNDETKYIPLVMYASGVSEDVFGQHRNLKTHADEYLKMPFPPEILVAAVQTVIPLGRSEFGEETTGDAPDDEEDGVVHGIDPVGSAEILEVDVVDVEEVDDDDVETDEEEEEEDDAEAPAERTNMFVDSGSNELGMATEAAFDALVEFGPESFEGAFSLRESDALSTEGPTAASPAEAGSPMAPLLAEEQEDDDPLAGFDPSPVPELELEFDEPRSTTSNLAEAPAPADDERFTPAPVEREPPPPLASFEYDALRTEPTRRDDPPSDDLGPAPSPLEFERPNTPRREREATDDLRTTPPPEAKALRTLVGVIPPGPLPPPGVAPKETLPAPSEASASGSAFKSQREVIQLKTQLNAKNREILTLKDELEAQQRLVLDAKHTQRELQAQIGDLEEKLLRAEEQTINARESAETVARDHGSATQRLQQADRRIQELQAKVAQLEPLVAQLDAVRTQLTELQRSDAKANADLEILRRQLESAREEQRGERETMHEQVVRLREELDEARHAVEARLEIERRAQQALAVALRVLDGQTPP